MQTVRWTLISILLVSATLSGLQDRNSLELADLVLAWIDAHVEAE